MSDESLKSPAVPSPDAGPRAPGPWAGPPDSPAPGKGNGERVDVPRERVELFMALRTLPDESGTERVPHGTLPPERMREVLRHLAENAYDSAAVQDVVARRVLKDLRLSTKG